MVFLCGRGIDYSFSVINTVLNYNLDSKINSFLYISVKNCNVSLRHLTMLEKYDILLNNKKD